MLTYINYCGIELKLENLIKDKSQDSSQFQNFHCDVKVKLQTFFFQIQNQLTQAESVELFCLRQF